MLKIVVTKTKSLECLIIVLLKVVGIAVSIAAVATEDAGVLVCELLVKVDRVLKVD